MLLDLNINIIDTWVPFISGVAFSNYDRQTNTIPISPVFAFIICIPDTCIWTRPDQYDCTSCILAGVDLYLLPAKTRFIHQDLTIYNWLCLYIFTIYILTDTGPRVSHKVYFQMSFIFVNPLMQNSKMHSAFKYNINDHTSLLTYCIKRTRLQLSKPALSNICCRRSKSWSPRLQKKGLQRFLQRTSSVRR